MEQWWEAKIVKIDKDHFTLQWRDYPKLPQIVRSRSSSRPDASGAKSGPELLAKRRRARCATQIARPNPLFFHPKIRSSIMSSPTERIRALNDQLRQNLSTGLAVSLQAWRPLDRTPSTGSSRRLGSLTTFVMPTTPTKNMTSALSSGGRDDLFQDRLLRQRSIVPLARPNRSDGHQAGHHRHAGQRILRAGVMHHMAMPSPTGAPFRPGFLMAPLGWLTQRLAPAPQGDPELLTAIFELDAYRMHGLGLGFAHCDPEGLSPSAVKALAHGPSQSALKTDPWPLAPRIPPGIRALPEASYWHRKATGPCFGTG